MQIETRKPEHPGAIANFRGSGSDVDSWKGAAPVEPTADAKNAWLNRSLDVSDSTIIID